MSVETVPVHLRTADYFHHIDMGFLNRRLCLTALPPQVRAHFQRLQKPGSGHMTVLANDHLLVEMLLDVCQEIGAPTLLEALNRKQPRLVFRSTERLEACPGVYERHARVEHNVVLDIDFGKPVRIAYHTEHLVSSTGTMTLAEGHLKGYVQSIVGLVHDRTSHYEVEPLVIGAPWLEHPRNGKVSTNLMWLSLEYGEILPEDIDQFAKMADVKIEDADEWMAAMRAIPEAVVKEAIATLLSEPAKKDWGGEMNDHFSNSVSVQGRRKTAAFLLKGPTDFREMTLDMCGKRADQIFRLTNSGADICVVQHAHKIGEAVRATLRALTIYPGLPRKYCLIDGPATYRLLKAYSLLPDRT